MSYCVSSQADCSSPSLNNSDSDVNSDADENDGEAKNLNKTSVIQLIYSLTAHHYTVSQKKSLHLCICHSLVGCHPILPILGRNILQEIATNKCTAHHISFHNVRTVPCKM